MSDGRAWLGIIPFALGGPGSSSQDNQALPSSGRLPPVLSYISVAFSLGTGHATKLDEFSEKIQMASTPPLIFGKLCCNFIDKRPKKPFIKVLGLYKGPRSCSQDNQELSSTYHSYVWLNHANCFGFNHNIILGWLNYPHQ